MEHVGVRMSGSKAEMAREFIQKNQLAYIRAIVTSSEAIVELLGATSIEMTEQQCPKCKQSWDKGSVFFTVAFDDGSSLQDSIGLGL